MNRKIERVREDIRRTEKNLRDLQDHLKTLRQKEEQLENEEIIRQIRAMGKRDGDVLEVLEKLYPQAAQADERAEESGESEHEAETN